MITHFGLATDPFLWSEWFVCLTFSWKLRAVVKGWWTWVLYQFGWRFPSWHLHNLSKHLIPKQSLYFHVPKCWLLKMCLFMFSGAVVDAFSMLWDAWMLFQDVHILVHEREYSVTCCKRDLEQQITILGRLPWVTSDRPDFITGLKEEHASREGHRGSPLETVRLKRGTNSQKSIRNRFPQETLEMNGVLLAADFELLKRILDFGFLGLWENKYALLIQPRLW